MKLSEAQRAELERGYCVLYLDRAAGGIRYSTWAALVDRGLIAHEQSNLDAKHPWERYRRTRAGLLATHKP